MILALLLLAAPPLLPWDPPPPRPAPAHFAPLDPLPRLSVALKGGLLLGVERALTGPYLAVAAAWQTHLLGDALLLEAELGGFQGSSNEVLAVAGSPQAYAYQVSRRGAVAFATAQLRKPIGLGVEVQAGAGLDYTVAQTTLVLARATYSLNDLQPGVHLGAGVEFALFLGTLLAEARLVATRVTLLGDPAPAQLVAAAVGYRLWF